MRLADPLRAALLGFITLFVIGSLMASGDQDARKRFYESYHEKQIEEREAGAPMLHLSADDPVINRAFARQQLKDIFGLGVIGAVLALATLAILRLVFPFGPTSKIVVGAICGPFLPILLAAPDHLANGKSAEDLGGLVVLGMLVGAMTGLVEANRVLRERRAAARETGAEAGL